MRDRFYFQTEYKSRGAKRIERERADKNLHGKDGSKHQKNKLLAKARRNEVRGDE